MPSTFFGLNIGASALFTYQAAINTTLNNIANVRTEGYSRQTVVRETTEALRVSARYGSCGTGVEAKEIIQERDLYYDDKYRHNNSKVGFYDQSLYYLDQIQTVFQDDEVQSGFTTILSSMFNSLDTLKNDAEDQSVRNQFINASQKLCTYFNSASASLGNIQDDCNQEIKASVNEINAIGKKIAILNREINVVELRGGHANELRDERAKLLDELSTYVSVDTVEHDVVNSNGDNLGGTLFTVTINGQVLVDNTDSYMLKCVEREYKHNKSDIDGLYDIIWENTGMRFAAASSSSDGSLKALFQIRDGNGADNMKGRVTDATGASDTSFGTVTIRPTVTDPNKLDLPEKGEVQIENKWYQYDGWSAEVATENGKGVLTSVTFHLVESSALASETADYLTASSAYLECGSTVDFMGCTYYQEQMNEFLREFIRQFNDIEKSGTTLDGDAMGAFFVGESKTGIVYEGSKWEKNEQGEYAWKTDEDEADEYGDHVITSEDDFYYKITADNVRVNLTSIKNPSCFATTSKGIQDGTAAGDLLQELQKLHSDVKFFRGSSANKYLEVMISDVTVDTQKKEVFLSNYSNLNETIDTMRMSISGVDEDDEGMNLIKFQNAYNLASKMISVMSEMYNKLINETGVA